MQELSVFRKRLVNLSGKNKSLLLTRLLSSRFFDLHQLDFLLNKPSFEVIAQLLARKTAVLCEAADSRMAQTNVASRQLNGILRQAKHIEEESGARDLYVGYPFVQGKLHDGTPVRCPLLFFAVELQLQQNKWQLRLRDGAFCRFNKTFLLAYAHFSGQPIGEQWLEYDFDEFAPDAQDFLLQLYKALEESPLELQFNRDHFNQRLQDFRQYTLADFKEQQRDGELKLQPEAVLGIFPQSDSYLMPDYDTLLANPERQNLEQFFVHAEAADTQHTEADRILPYPTDASQDRAIAQVKAGRSVVVQGPPGSGKSQLICNLIADAMANGKTVLVVSQKKAALDVVKNRLAQQGFDRFAALVHDFQADRAAVFAQINDLANQIEQFKEANQHLDTITLDREYKRVCREIEQATQALEEFKEALFDSALCGLSAKELYLTAQAQQPALAFEAAELTQLRFEGHSERLAKLKAYAQDAARFDREDYLLYDRVSFARFQLQDLAEFKQTAQAVLPLWQAWQQQADKLMGKPLGLAQLHDVLANQQAAEQWAAQLNDETYTWFVHLHAAEGVNLKRWGLLKNEVQRCFEGAGVEQTLPHEAVAFYLQAVAEALVAQQAFAKRLFYRLFHRERKKIAALLAANHLPETADGLSVLLLRLENRRNLERLRTQLNNLPWLLFVPTGFEGQAFAGWFETVRLAWRAAKDWKKLNGWNSLLRVGILDFAEFTKEVQLLAHLGDRYRLAKLRWARYWTDGQINAIFEQRTAAAAYLAVIERDFDWLCAYDALYESFSAVERKVLLRLREAQNGVWDAEQTVRLFDNGLRLAWLGAIEAQNPVLRTVSTRKFAQTEQLLQTAVAEKQVLCTQIALMRVRENACKDLAYNRLHNLVTYRDLKHQTAKKRHVYTLRKLMHAFADEIFGLVPCWLASPETVSAVFPLVRLFDLVIFDEASQCFAERGIPALCRGKQAVVCGDSQQLAPLDLYQPRREEDEDGNPALEIDSLLDLGARFLPQIQLTGHYRSRSHALIAFSNKHFYQNKLQLLPDYAEFAQTQPPIVYLKTDGVWEQNRNHAEAHEVLRLVRDLLAQNQTDIGIITFNQPQQALILDLLEAQNVVIPPQLFVKNIENVQGDERDIIIFSVGYAPSPSGRMALQFGSLSLPKGENRLNVAVSRAKARIYVVSSIWPHQLQTDDTKNAGPKLLRDYLHFAHEVSNRQWQYSTENNQRFGAGWYLKNRLLQNKEAYTDLPFADFYLKEPQGVVLYFTDDDRYYAEQSVKNAHAYIPNLLKAKGWTFKRLFSREYWRGAVSL